MPTLFCSLKPHLRQVLYVEGMVYIIIILLCNFITRDLAAKAVARAGKLKGAWSVPVESQLLSTEEAVLASCPASPPLGRAVRRPVRLWLLVCLCTLCSWPCTSFAGAICLNCVFSLARGKAKRKIPACLKRYREVKRGCCSVVVRGLPGKKGDIFQENLCIWRKR